MSDAIDTKDTKEAGDMLPAMTADEKMIQDGFNELLKDYLNSNHRRKVERITKAFNFANQAHAGVKRGPANPISCTPLPLHGLFAVKWDWGQLLFVRLCSTM